MYNGEIGRIYDAGYDFPRRDEPPSTTYMIATIPRSGSHFFCFELWRTGIYGAPLEYLNVENIPPIAHRLGGGDLYRYWSELRRVRASQNGVFGYKAHIHHYEMAAKANPEILPLITPQHIIYLTRQDVLAQAASIARAVQTESLFSSVPERSEPIYRKILMDHALSVIDEQSQGWETYFAATQTSPLRITYEEILSDRTPVLNRIGDLLGAPLDTSHSLDIPLLSIQRDDKNREWIDRYLEEGSEALDRLARSTDT